MTTLEQARRDAELRNMVRNPMARDITLRDYFAGKALQGLCAGFASQDANWPSDESPEHYEVAAEHAYQMADAMLEARKK